MLRLRRLPTHHTAPLVKELGEKRKQTHLAAHQKLTGGEQTDKPLQGMQRGKASGKSKVKEYVIAKGPRG